MASTSRGCSSLKHVTLTVLLLTVNVCGAQNGTCDKNTHSIWFVVWSTLAFAIYEKVDCLAASTGANDSSNKAHAVKSVETSQ
jgi:hypothetical protein